MSVYTEFKELSAYTIGGRYDLIMEIEMHPIAQTLLSHFIYQESSINKNYGKNYVYASYEKLAKKLGQYCRQTIAKYMQKLVSDGWLIEEIDRVAFDNGDAFAVIKKRYTVNFTKIFNALKITPPVNEITPNVNELTPDVKKLTTYINPLQIKKEEIKEKEVDQNEDSNDIINLGIEEKNQSIEHTLGCKSEFSFEDRYCAAQKISNMTELSSTQLAAIGLVKQVKNGVETYVQNPMGNGRGNEARKLRNAIWKDMAVNAGLMDSMEECDRFYEYMKDFYSKDQWRNDPLGAAIKLCKALVDEKAELHDQALEYLKTWQKGEHLGKPWERNPKVKQLFEYWCYCQLKSTGDTDASAAVKAAKEIKFNGNTLWEQFQRVYDRQIPAYQKAQELGIEYSLPPELKGRSELPTDDETILTIAGLVSQSESTPKAYIQAHQQESLPDSVENPAIEQPNIVLRLKIKKMVEQTKNDPRFKDKTIEEIEEYSKAVVYAKCGIPKLELKSLNYYQNKIDSTL